MASSRVRSKSKDIVYPESDGKPLGETGWHIQATIDFYSSLRRLFAGRQDVYVASNMFLYYVEGNPSKVVCPDCMAIFGVEGNHDRATFKTWVERAVPAFVLEVSSKKTIRNDLGKKMAVYADLGVVEYFLYDPLRECLNLPLLGYRLDAAGFFQPIPPLPAGGLRSETLGLVISPEARELRLVDPDTDARHPFIREYPGLLEDAREAKEREHQRAEREHQRAEREHQRAEREHQRAEELSSELERLKKLHAEGLAEPDHRS